MVAGSVEIAGAVAARPSRNGRRARKPFDGRFVIGKRVRELVDVFRTRIGSDADDPVTSTAIRRCAETVALSEDLRARMLRGQAVSPDDVLRATRTADLMTRRLHLDRHRAAPSAQPSLSSYLAARQPETRASEAPAAVAGPSSDEGAP